MSWKHNYQLSHYNRTNCTCTYMTYSLICTVAAGRKMANMQNQRWFLVPYACSDTHLSWCMPFIQSASEVSLDEWHALEVSHSLLFDYFSLNIWEVLKAVAVLIFIYLTMSVGLTLQLQNPVVCEVELCHLMQCKVKSAWFILWGTYG